MKREEWQKQCMMSPIPHSLVLQWREEVERIGSEIEFGKKEGVG